MDSWRNIYLRSTFRTAHGIGEIGSVGELGRGDGDAGEVSYKPVKANKMGRTLFSADS